MKALISPDEFFRVAEIHETGFDVASPLFWVDCPDGVKAHDCWYDQETQTVKILDIEPEQPEE
jgi:hypothetical protein